MRQFLLPLFALLFIFGCSPKAATGMQSPSARNPAPAAAPEPSLTDTTLLWKITTAGATEPSYLFGTIHLIPEDDYFMPDRVVRALNASEKVFFEIDPRDMQDISKIMGLMMKINMTGGQSLNDLLSEEEYATVKEYFADSPLPFMLLERMKPLFVSSLVGQDAGGMGGGEMPGMGGLGGFSGMKSYEMELTTLAEAAGKEIGGLETMDFQLSLFDSIDYADQAQMLYEAVRSDQNKEETGEDNDMDIMVDMYRRQAVAEMANLMKDEGTAGMARFEELLLTRRNENWTPTIKAAAGRQATFYAVGAGHLGGPKGVISLLRQAGVTVEPVY